MSNYAPPKATPFNPQRYRQSLAELFIALDPRQRTEMLDGLALIPRHIHRMAMDGRISAPPLDR